MRELVRTLPLMCLVLLVPILPFLFFGGTLESWLRGMTEEPPAAGITAALVVTLLSTDIFLPIPSSVVSTLCGWQLGWWKGTLATWLGLNIGAVLGFAIAHRWGQPVALWFTKAEDLDKVRQLSQRYGPALLVITRGMPVLAEATVLIAGIHRLSWRKFLPAVFVSNLGIALAYCAFSDFAERHQWLPLALGIAVALPIIVAAVGQRWWLSVRADHPSAAMEDEAAVASVEQATILAGHAERKP